MSKLSIKYKSTADLIPYARNSRIHSEAQIAQIAASIREFGFKNPVLIDGENGIITGHGRVLAALKLDMAEVPTIDGSDLTESQKRAYIIADNRIALNSEWDAEMLMLEIKDLREIGVDIDILAFDPSEIQDKALDYSILDDENVDEQLDSMVAGTRKAIQIEFELDHYEEAQELIKFWREQGAYIGGLFLDTLRKEKENL